MSPNSSAKVNLYGGENEKGRYATQRGNGRGAHASAIQGRKYTSPEGKNKKNCWIVGLRALALAWGRADIKPTAMYGTDGNTFVKRKACAEQDQHDSCSCGGCRNGCLQHHADWAMARAHLGQVNVCHLRHGQQRQQNHAQKHNPSRDTRSGARAVSALSLKEPQRKTSV